eukprot:CAMPEP_0203890106 /NCGR_PEP_ID=MMETSP0359-20131031/33573_1 /ASSEMBLY_ACC=CAM_ASM_000338 /TAXON_ID=268821 /ORGANISM="Scrippsiella Hangoei, Strain SHTV-5" /LENGTH=63 /DNA_ID=CAMNT_0050811653 /DNA_START=75 /DNA_END=262 /DNA_ORIENTATION=+
MTLISRERRAWSEKPGKPANSMACLTRNKSMEKRDGSALGGWSCSNAVRSTQRAVRKQSLPPR